MTFVDNNQVLNNPTSLHLKSHDLGSTASGGGGLQWALSGGVKGVVQRAS